MSERIDREIGSNHVLLATIIVLFILAGGAGSYVWVSMTRQSSPIPIEPPASPIQPLLSGEPLTVTLFIPENGMLSTSPAAVKRQPDTQSQAHEAVAAVLADVRSRLSPALKELKLRGFFLDDAGTAYVDLAQVSQSMKASAEDELLALHAIVNTVMQNFEEIRQVRFLMEGREAQTLAGHIDLSAPFRKRKELLKQ